MSPDPIAALLARAGREIILPAFAGKRGSQRKQNGSIVTETDFACQDFLQKELYKIDPSIGFLGEEMAEDVQDLRRGCSGRYWCLDPLDGTTNFEAGFPMFAISLALIEDGMPQQAWIHDPLRDETFTADTGAGARLNGRPILASRPAAPEAAIGCIDFKRLPPKLAAQLLMPGVYRSQRNLGSCALEWGWLAAGRVHFIIHGGEKLWDFAAGGLIAAEAGCLVGDFAGKPLFPAPALSSTILACCGTPLHDHLAPYLAD